MVVSQLFSIYAEYRLGQNPQAEVTRIVTDSRDVKSGDVFVAIRGTSVDGHAFLDQVIAQKPAAIVAEKI
ncbi:MAG: Mur ligase domain-containing protein [Bdellovibrionales bacterium]